MKAAPLPPNETERQKLFRNLEKLDVAPADFFDEITRAIAFVCNAQLALVCLSESYQQWFRIGPEGARQAREFCARLLPQETFMLVPDTREDERLRDDPAVKADPGIRFYAAVPLEFSSGITLGTLCVIDQHPHTLDSMQVTLLKLLAGHVVTLIKTRLGKLEDHHDFGEMALSKQRLQYQKELLEAVLDNEPESVHILSRDGGIVQINHAGVEMLEAGSQEELRLRNMGEFVLPEFRAIYTAMLDDVFQGKQCIVEYRIAGLRGTVRWMESHAAPLRDIHGEIVSLVAIARDVTHMKESQRKLMLAARVFSEAQEGIIITDTDGAIVDVNPAFCRITGYSREEIIGQNPRILQSGRQGRDFYAALWKTLATDGHWKGEMWNKKKNGELYAELISINALRDEAGNAINYVALFLDITEVKRQREHLEQMAHYSSITGLPKHAMFTDRFSQALACSKRDKTMLAVCHFDLDNFRKMNDTLGHKTCNELLTETAKRIKASLRGKDTASSLGGDEFVLLLGDIHNITDCKRALERIHRAIAEPHLINGQTASITASSSVALYHKDNANQETLLLHAEQAMRHAKREGRNRYHFFDMADDA